MLTATSHNTYGDARVRSTLLLERRFRAHLMWRDRLLFDSRYLAPAREAADVATVYLSLDGTLETAAGTHRSPVAFVLAEREFERVEPAAPWFRSWGDPAVVLGIRVERNMVRAPIGLDHGPVAVGDMTWRALEALAEATAVEGDVVPPFVTLLRGLHADGLLAVDLSRDAKTENALIRHLWQAAVPYYQQFLLGSTMEDLGNTRGKSLRQLVRETSTFTASLPLFGGFRSTLVLLRLRLATLLLSSPAATLADVARWVGYASVDAMAGSFRDGGLPPPSVVRTEVRYPVV